MTRYALFFVFLAGCDGSLGDAFSLGQGEDYESPFTSCADAGSDAFSLPTSSESAEAHWRSTAHCSGIGYESIECELVWFAGGERCESGPPDCTDGLYSCEMCPASGRLGHENGCDHGGITAGEGAR